MRCSRLGEDGLCTDYANRPELCRRYRCLWHLGLLPERFRPDQCGVLYVHRHDEEVYRLVGDPYVIDAHELVEGAYELEDNRLAIEALAEKFVVVASSMVDDDYIEVEGPGEKREKVVGYFLTKLRYLRVVPEDLCTA